MDTWLRSLWSHLAGSPASAGEPVDPQRIWQAARGELDPEATRVLLERASRDPDLAREWRLAMAVDAIDWAPVTPPVGERVGEAARAALDWLLPEGPGAFGLRWQVAGVLGAPKVRPGDRFQVHIGPVEDPEGRRIVVLAQRRTAWEVVFPVTAEEDLALTELPQSADGSRTLDLLAGEPAGRQRWAVVLPAVDRSFDFGLPPRSRWASLAADVAAGEVPVATVEVVVAPAG